jgi:hypothetical protein
MRLWREFTMTDRLIVMRVDDNGEVRFTLSSDEVMIRALEAYREQILARDETLNPDNVELLMLPTMIRNIQKDN